MEIRSGWMEMPAEPLRLLLPKGRGEYLCTKPSVKIGRNADCDICLREIPTLSRYHAEIFCREGAWYIRDTNSVNGTYLNGQRLAPGAVQPLGVGDQIRLAADVTLEILPMDPEQTVSPAPIIIDYGSSTMDVGAVPPVREPVRAVRPPDWEGTGTVVCRFCGRRINGRFCPVCGGMQNTPSFGADSTAFLNEDSDYAISMAPPPPSQFSPPTAPSMAPRSAPSMAPPPPPPPSSAPAKKPGLFGKLFGGKKEPVKPAAAAQPVRAAAPAPQAAPQSDDVQFRGAAPQNINPGEYFTVKIMMYREDDYQRADRETAAVADQVKAASSGVFQANRGQNFRIVLQSPDVDLEAGDETLVWNGIFAAADFEVYLPENYDKRQLRLRGRVYSGDAVLTDLKLILQVRAAAPQQVVCEKVQLRTAFISYASADRAKVVARLQGILLACPEMDLFFDVESLRRGEAWEPRLYREISRRDLFYLFWSRNAADSQWVQKELEYAVSQKTVEFIEPIPLEGPDICPPPEALMCKHFNDWTLRYLNNN